MSHRQNNKEASSAERRSETTQEHVACDCGGPLRLVDSHGTSCTGYCTTCERYSLLVARPAGPRVILLSDFHLKRGDAPDQRPLGDLSMATRLVRCLVNDSWPTPATVVDFGIDSADHYRALQYSVRCGCTAYDLDRVMGDGPAITKLVRGFPLTPHFFVEFKTAYDGLIAASATEE